MLARSVGIMPMASVSLSRHVGERVLTTPETSRLDLCRRIEQIILIR